MGSTAEQTTNGMPDYSSIKKEGLFRQTWNGLRRNRLAMFGLALIVILVLIAVFADFIAPFGVDEQDLTGKFLKPGGRHLFGTDEFGRDIFSRIVYGSRYSLMIGAVAATLSAVIGMIAGSLAGFYGGRTDNILMLSLPMQESSGRQFCRLRNRSILRRRAPSAPQISESL